MTHEDCKRTTDNNHKNYAINKIIKGSFICVVFLLTNTVTVKAEQIAMLNNTGDSRIQNVSENGTPGFAPMNSIGSTVFSDTNGNGKQDDNEEGVAGLTVALLDDKGHEIQTGPDGILGNDDDLTGSVTTDSHGRYRFYQLPPNTYRVSIISE